MIPSVKVPRIPLFFCKLGKFIVAIAKITLIILIAGYDFPMGTEFMERQNISIIIGAISMVIFIILDLTNFILLPFYHALRYFCFLVICIPILSAESACSAAFPSLALATAKEGNHALFRDFPLSM